MALRRHFARRLASVGIAALLWLALVYRTQVVSEYFTVTVGSDTPPAGLTAVQISPSSVEVRVEGPRRALRRLRPSAIRLSLKADQASPGFQMLPVSEQMINVPEGFRITDIRPRQVLAKFEPMVPSPATRP